MLVSCPSHKSPTGHNHCKIPTNKRRGRKDLWKGCLQLATVLSTVNVCVCVCECMFLCIPMFLFSPEMSYVVYPYVCMHAFWQYSCLPGECLSRDQQHAYPRCQNVVSSKQSDDMLSVIQAAHTHLRWVQQAALEPGVLQIKSRISVKLGH